MADWTTEIVEAAAAVVDELSREQRAALNGRSFDWPLPLLQEIDAQVHAIVAAAAAAHVVATARAQGVSGGGLCDDVPCRYNQDEDE